VKLEIINISSEFVAGFWNSVRKKYSKPMLAVEMLRFSTIEEKQIPRAVRPRVGMTTQGTRLRFQ
jgi:hypothetical protein